MKWVFFANSDSIRMYTRMYIVNTTMNVQLYVYRENA